MASLSTIPAEHRQANLNAILDHADGPPKKIGPPLIQGDGKIRDPKSNKQLRRHSMARATNASNAPWGSVQGDANAWEAKARLAIEKRP